jgi:hypothetical protein
MPRRSKAHSPDLQLIRNPPTDRIRDRNGTVGTTSEATAVHHDGPAERRRKIVGEPVCDLAG